MLLEVKDLSVEFLSDGRIIRAVNGLTYSIQSGETLGIVGESGSGKSVGALALTRLLPRNGHITRGEVWWEQQDLMRLSVSALRQVRGGGVSYVFQEPATALNPVMRIGAQLLEGIRLHQGMEGEPARTEVVRWLRRVGLSDAGQLFDAYPHELSGGMKQRAMIAQALACGSRMMVADEPTTALDVTTQAKILELLDTLRRDEGLSIVLITHDISLVERWAQRVAVMYAGQVVEIGPTKRVLRYPQHPYTQALISCVPDPSRGAEGLRGIPGEVPDPADLPRGCPFHPRCPEVEAACRTSEPRLESVSADEGHQARCPVMLHREAG